MDSGLPHHPKLLKLKRYLGSPGCWSFICLVAYTAEHKADGKLDLTKTEIERVAQWGGAKGKFVKALLAANLLIQEGDHYVLDWQLPQAKKRSERARKAALSRWQKYAMEKNKAIDDAGDSRGSAKDSESCSANGSSPFTEADLNGHSLLLQALPYESKHVEMPQGYAPSNAQVDWENHPNTKAYKARCAEDPYAFLSEFPPGSPEQALRASFFEWFQGVGGC